MLTYFLVGLGTYMLISLCIRVFRDFSYISSSWHHIFEELQFSSEDFYTSLKAAVDAKEMPNTTTEVVPFEQGGLGSEDRKYLRIRRGEWMFLVCAAPFAKGFFISYRIGAPNEFFKNLILSIPFIGFLSAKFVYRKTYYREDSDAMFTEVVKGCIKDAIDGLVQTKGARPLTEFEEQSFIVGSMQNLYT